MSESREFLLGLTILFVLGAWAATAQDAESNQTTVVDLAEYGLASSENLTFDMDQLTWWKSVQLQAAAMSEPKALLNYSAGRSATLADIVALSSPLEWQTPLHLNGGTFKVGVLVGDNQFVEIADSANCLQASCDGVIWGKLGQAASARLDSDLMFSNGEKFLFGEPIKVSDLRVFWTANAERTNAWGNETVLKALNYQ